MNTFLKKLSIFILIPTSYFAFCFLTNNLLLYKAQIPLEKTNILIAGDSHSQTSLNPDFFNSANNISQTGEPYIVTYWKLKHLLSITKPDTLILSFSHHNISGFNDYKFVDGRWSVLLFNRIYLIHELHQLKDIEIDFIEFYKVYFRNMFLYPKRKHYNYIGKYSNANSCSTSNLKNKIKRHYFHNNTDAGISEIAISYLDSIIHVCQRNNITPIIIGSPVHKKYYTRIPKHIKERYLVEINRLKKQNVFVIDCSNHFYTDNYYFDFDHLNEQGASVFTIEILELIHLLKE